VARTHEDGTNLTTRVGCNGPPKAITDRNGPVDRSQLTPTQLARVSAPTIGSWHDAADELLQWISLGLKRCDAPTYGALDLGTLIVTHVRLSPQLRESAAATITA